MSHLEFKIKPSTRDREKPSVTLGFVWRLAVKPSDGESGEASRAVVSRGVEFHNEATVLDALCSGLCLLAEWLSCGLA